MLSQLLPVLMLLAFAAALLALAVVLWPRPRDRVEKQSMKRVIADELAVTPTLKAAAVRTGSVQVAGTVEAASTLRTPIWGAECVAYHVAVLTERAGMRRQTGELQKTEVSVMGSAHEETGGVPFDVVDDTGRVRVDVDSRVRLAMSSARVSRRGLLSRLTPEAQRYLDHVMDTLGGPVELRESWVPVGRKCHVVGEGVSPTEATPGRLVHGHGTILISE